MKRTLLQSAIHLSDLRLALQVLLGHRYGGHPPPNDIAEAEFEALCSALESNGSSAEPLREAYCLDSNSLAPRFTLRPIAEDPASVRAVLCWFDVTSGVKDGA